MLKKVEKLNQGIYLVVDSCYIIRDKYEYEKLFDQIYKNQESLCHSNALSEIMLDGEIVFYADNDFGDVSGIEVHGDGVFGRIMAGCDAGHHLFISADHKNYGKYVKYCNSSLNLWNYRVIELSEDCRNPVIKVIDDDEDE